MASDLLSFIIDPDDGDCSLHITVLSGCVDSVRKILRSDEGRELINVRMRPFGATPLRLAASGIVLFPPNSFNYCKINCRYYCDRIAGNVDCVRELLKNGAYIDLADIKAQTPLFLAVHNNHLKCCEVLLKFGANPNGDCRNLVSPLHVACQTGNAAAAYLLLQHGSAIEGALTHPLHVTAAYGHLNCFILLLLHGAKTNLTEYAVGQPSILPILAKHKSRPIFLHLWVLFGGSLWFCDKNGFHNILDVNESPSSETLHILRSEGKKLILYECLCYCICSILVSYIELCCILAVPLSLKSQCRIIIWKILENDILKRIKYLDLPNTLLNFLVFRDIPEVDRCFVDMDAS